MIKGVQIRTRDEKALVKFRSYKSMVYFLQKLKASDIPVLSWKIIRCDEPPYPLENINQLIGDHLDKRIDLTPKIIEKAEVRDWNLYNDRSTQDERVHG